LIQPLSRSFICATKHAAPSGAGKMPVIQAPFRVSGG
jgi:hypothetical protein